MKQTLMKQSTPYITGLFLVSLISGVALFFHFEQGWFHAMHEWLSMVLILPFVLHIWRNWKSFVNYFKRRSMTVALILSTVAAVAFASWPSSSDGRRAGGPPQFAFANTIIRETPNVLAPVFGLTATEMVVLLKDNGFENAEPEMPLIEVIKASGQRPEKLYALLSTSANNDPAK